MTSELPPLLCDRDASTGGYHELAMQLASAMAVRGLAQVAGLAGP
jgi:hypothetical protein